MSRKHGVRRSSPWRHRNARRRSRLAIRRRWWFNVRLGQFGFRRFCRFRTVSRRFPEGRHRLRFLFTFGRLICRRSAIERLYGRTCGRWCGRRCTRSGLHRGGGLRRRIAACAAFIRPTEGCWTDAAGTNRVQAIFTIGRRRGGFAGSGSRRAITQTAAGRAWRSTCPSGLCGGQIGEAIIVFVLEVVVNVFYIFEIVFIIIEQIFRSAGKCRFER